MFGTFTFEHNRLKRDGCSTTVCWRSPASTSANRMSKPISLLPSRSISAPRVQAEAAGPLLRASHTAARKSIKRTAANLTPDPTESPLGFIGTEVRVIGGICTAVGVAYLAYRKLVRPAGAKKTNPSNDPGLFPELPSTTRKRKRRRLASHILLASAVSALVALAVYGQGGRGDDGNAGEFLGGGGGGGGGDDGDGDDRGGGGGGRYDTTSNDRVVGGANHDLVDKSGVGAQGEDEDEGEEVELQRAFDDAHTGWSASSARNSPQNVPSTLHEDMTSLISDASVWSSEGTDIYEGRSDDVFITAEMEDPDNTLQEQANSDASSAALLRSSSTDYNPFPYEDGIEYANNGASSSTDHNPFPYEDGTAYVGEQTSPSSPPGQTSPPANDSSSEPSTPQSQPASPPLAASSSATSLRVRTSFPSPPAQVFSPFSEFSLFSELSPGSPNSLSWLGVLVEDGDLADAGSLDDRLRALTEATGPVSSNEEDAENDLDAGSDGSWEDIIDGLSLHE